MGEICAPVQASPLPPPECRRSRPGRPCATWPTGRLDNGTVKWTGAVAPRREGSSDVGARGCGARGCAAPGAPTHPTRLFHIPRRTRTPTLRSTANPLDVLAIQPSRGPVSGGGKMNMADTSNSPLLPTGSLSRSNCAGPSDEHRQEEQSRCRRILSRAKMRAVVALSPKGVDAMNSCDHHISCHHYARLRPSRTAGATDPLSARMSQDAALLDSRPPSRSRQTGHHILGRENP